MKYIILFLFIPFIFFAQEKQLQITNSKDGKTFVIKENKRVKIKTIDGEKLFGRLKFIDDNTILIDEKTLTLEQIKFIKKRSLATAIVATSLIVVGSLTLGFSSVIAIVDTQAALITSISSLGLTTFAILLPSLSKKFSTTDYDLQIVEVSN